MQVQCAPRCIEYRVHVARSLHVNKPVVVTFTVPCRDFLGYYRQLGLAPDTALHSQTDIKTAFRQAALLWHTDKHNVSAFDLD